MAVTTLPATSSVVIVGAGPVGLTAAIVLAEAGVDYVLIDRLAEGANTSRAAVVHARTLEVLDELGIADELVGLGIKVPTFKMHDGPKTLATVEFGGLPTAFPYTLMVPQDVTERVLLDRLHKAGGQVHRPITVTAVRNEKDSATVEYVGVDGTPGSITADYVVGADGMHSVVREHAGIGFTGDTYPASFILADVRMAWPSPRSEVSLHLSPEGVTVVAPLPDPHDERYRVVATVDEAPEHPTREDIQALLDARGPAGEVQVDEVLWSSRFRVHHRVADHYRAGHVLLAGDAAHVHSPAGGQGMNTGIQDAALLGTLLAKVAAGEPDSVLDTYETIRRPIATEVVAFTDRMTKMATLGSAPARTLRNTAMSVLTRIPAIRTKLAYQLAELGSR
ncbi:FAD-dependent oxidoreductase [Nocardia caishijiensis]|uniref:2-polyprenyl-6-methoxyphenol hydroxylase-like FAD-dependent oxidoreductase n=1 Tax=Nocardia caishijiensis TaxID=184756 RepID=A0ABQ6YQ59_9NOCA|nr:FAD-dependent monooxygenase [Nocardia caishijiensis]KAF0847934.1 2-polyprenyl-6-methoxyphenol hydroxylase-like FAD-dependent oxidoreductase [Nocardia caishijiensis]